MKRILAIDVGTGSCRAAIYTDDLEQIGSAVVEYSSQFPQRDWAEQDAATLLSSVIAAVNRCRRKGERVDAMIIDTALHSVLGLDSDLSPITPILTWEDRRANGIVKRWRNDVEAETLYSRTGCALHPMYPPAKIVWWRENNPQLLSRIKYFTSMKGFLMHRLTGRLVEEKSTASGSGLLNIHTLDWDDKALEFTGIDREMLPPVLDPTEILEGLTGDLCRETGLPENLPVIAGCSDAALSSLGSGAIRDDQMTLMVGTSGAARRLVDHPILDDRGRTWCYYLSNDVWIAGGAINNGGNILRWFRDEFGDRAKLEAARTGETVYERLNTYARSVPPGSDGLLFLPFLAGERSPYWNADMRGIIAGLSIKHGQREFVRAIMEGVAFQMRSICVPLNEMLGQPTEIRATGGFARSDVWLQIMADVIGQELSVTNEPEGSILGAAAFALKTLGTIKSYEALETMNPVIKRVEPAPERHRFYLERYAIYEEIYRRIADIFDGSIAEKSTV